MSSIDDYLLPNKVLCNFIGLWPISENASMLTRIFAHFRLIFALVAIGNILIPEMLAIGINWGDITVLTGVGCVATTVTLLIFKMMYILHLRKRFDNLYLTIRELWDVTDLPHERKSFETFAWQAKIFTILFFLSGFGNNITFTSAAVVNWIKQYYNREEESPYIRQQPFEVWYSFDIQSSPNYEIVFGCQSIGAIVCCVGIVGLDAFMVTMVMHLCGQFTLLRMRFRDIGANIDQHYPELKHVDPSTILDLHFLNEVHLNIRECILHHQKIINVANELEDLLNPVIFVQFVTSAVEICLSGFAVTTGVNDYTDLIKYTNYLISMMIQQFAWCWPGEVLIRESSGVGDAVYFGIPWYKLPASLQKDLIPIIARTQRHCQLTAAKFHTMSISTLGNIFTTAVSYFTLLQQIKGE